MTTYTFYKNMIIVSFDDNSIVFMSDSQLKKVFSFLLCDFCSYFLTLKSPARKQYYHHVYKMIDNIRAAHLEHQITIDMLRNLFFIVNRFNYPGFRIIFVNEI